MRTIYLIRHGKPLFPGGKRFCLSSTDLPLSSIGSLQAALAAEILPAFPEGNLFSSPLLRARDTAAFFGKVQTNTSLRELGMGDWEGLPFSEIRALYPELYEKRGLNPFAIFPPNGEAPTACRRRTMTALDSLLKSTEGDIAVVSHAGALRLLLCGLNLCPPENFLSVPQPYGGITKLSLARGVITAEEIGIVPHPSLTPAFCEKLLLAAKTPEKVIRHAKAVSRQAVRLSEGLAVDHNLLICAALLHDIARTEPEHDITGARWIEEIGYPEAAALIRTHMDLQAESPSIEAMLLFLADKTVLNETPVTLAVRFAASEEKCGTEAALAAHKLRYEKAVSVYSSLFGGKHA